MYARHATSVIDSTLLSTLFLIKTKEGNSEVKTGCMICRGLHDDYWVQSIDAIIKKYELSGVDNDGWFIFIPKKGVQTKAVQVKVDDDYQFIIKTAWGTPSAEVLGQGFEGYVQVGDSGDYILSDSPDNFWVVKAKIFDETYKFVNTK